MGLNISILYLCRVVIIVQEGETGAGGVRREGKHFMGEPRETSLGR